MSSTSPCRPQIHGVPEDRCADQIDNAALQAWLAEALSVQWDYKNIVRRKGLLEWLA